MVNLKMKDLIIMKHLNFFHIIKRVKYESCISCKKITTVLKSTPIINRNFYIETSGQLCKVCFVSIYKNK